MSTDQAMRSTDHQSEMLSLSSKTLAQRLRHHSRRHLPASTISESILPVMALSIPKAFRTIGPRSREFRTSMPQEARTIRAQTSCCASLRGPLIQLLYHVSWTTRECFSGSSTGEAWSTCHSLNRAMTLFRVGRVAQGRLAALHS